MQKKIYTLMLVALMILGIGVNRDAIAATILKVDGGGTGSNLTNAFGWLFLSGNATVASSSPTVKYIVATSTTPSQFPYASTTGTSATFFCISTDCRSAWPAAGSSFSWPFDIASHWGQTTAGTTTALWLQGSPFSLFASSTAAFESATTTTLEAKSAAWLSFITSGRVIYAGTSGKLLGVATTSETCSSPLSCTAHDVLTGGGAISLGTVTVANGGTNVTSYPANSIITSDAAGTSLIATTSKLTVTTINATSTSATSTFANAVAITANSQTGSSNQGVTEGTLLINNTNSKYYGLQVYSSQTAPSAALATLVADQSTFSQPMLYIQDSSTNAASTGLRIDHKGFPAIAFVDTSSDNTDGAGKYQFASHNNLFRIEGRDIANGSFIPDFVMGRDGATSTEACSYGRIGMFTGFGCGNSRLEVIGTSTLSQFFSLTSITGATTGDLFQVLQNGNVGVGTSTPVYPLTSASSTAPQFALSSGAGVSQWVMRTLNDGTFVMATTTTAGTATSSASIFKLDTNGFLTLSSLAGVGCAQFDANGKITNTGSACGSGGGTTVVSTSTNETAGQLAYWTTTSGTPAKLGKVATTSETCSSPLSCTAHDVLTGGGAISLGTVTVANGGTNKTSYPANTLISSDAAGTTLGATSTAPLYLGAVNATSTIQNSIFNNNSIAFGTTTFTIGLATFASSTAPQLSLSAGAGIAQWAFRNAGGNLYIGTTTVAGTATTSTAALSILATGKPGITIASTSSSTPVAMLTVAPEAGNFAYSFWVGTTTEYFRVDNGGKVFAPNTVSSGSSQTGYWCYDTNGQYIRDTAVCLVSALKFKKDVKPLDLGLNDLMKLRPVTYYKKDPLGAEDSHMQMGFIADEVASASPALNETLVTYVGGGTSGEVHAFRYDQFTALITKSVQDLNNKVDQIKGVARSAEENWQDILIGLLILGFGYQQWQIKKLRK